MTKKEREKDFEHHDKIYQNAKMPGKMRDNYRIQEEFGNAEYGDLFKCQY